MIKVKKLKTTSKFDSSFRKLPLNVQQEALKKEKAFIRDIFDKSLRTHKLKGSLKDYYSFSITYSYRILFSYEENEIITFLDIGDHSIYNQII